MELVTAAQVPRAREGPVNMGGSSGTYILCLQLSYFCSPLLPRLPLGRNSSTGQCRGIRWHHRQHLLLAGAGKDPLVHPLQECLHRGPSPSAWEKGKPCSVNMTCCSTSAPQHQS